MAAIIFDFDGTIADSFETVVQIFYELTGRREPLSADQIQRLRGTSLHQAAKELQIARWRIPFLLLKGRRRMRRVVAQLEPFAGIPELIHKLHAEGHELFIVSSNSVANIRAFLHRHNLHTYFLEMYGSVGLFNKRGALRRLLKDQNLEVVQAAYVGDEVRDVQAAQSLKLRVIAVAWGFAAGASLQAARPTALAKQPADLLRILEEV